MELGTETRYLAAKRLGLGALTAFAVRQIAQLPVVARAQIGRDLFLVQ
jgi:hypothetical protein